MQPAWISAVDLTSLDRSKETKESIQILCEKALRLQTACVCIYPEHIQAAKRNPGLTVATVVSFPDGMDSQCEVVASVARAIADGVDEIDVVWDYTAFNENRLADAVKPIEWTKAAVRACGAQGIRVKVILETGAIKQDRLANACELVLQTFDDAATIWFLKTSTGKKGYEGATVHSAKTMLESIKCAGKMHNVGLKVSGGVKTVEQAQMYSSLAESFGCGLFRIGASSLLDAF
ncbi:UNVERIFIED_CONTAM: hypothetical protein HDU68_002261 [Siphonaria sp. JEL0065]|nr:hypothetical protein HDU68_002261 [Siphonaria sp. JEL0065]